MSTEGDLMPTTQKLVERWERAVNAVDRAKNDLSREECELSNAQTALAKFLTPENAKPGETFHIWHTNYLLSVCGENVTKRRAR